MELKLYRIDSAIVHPDNYVKYKKDPKELRKFFGLGKGDAEKILRMKIFFDAGEAYDASNIILTDYINSPVAPLFSKRAVEIIKDRVCDEALFVPVMIRCSGECYEWYACRIDKRVKLINEETSVFRELTDGTKIISLARYRTDIEEDFYMAKDIDYNDVLIMSQSFKRICDENNLNIRFLNPEIHLA